jgi:uncharacterized membrane protein
MSQLIVVGFKKDLFRASEVLHELQELNEDWVLDLHDAVAAYRDYSSNIRIDQNYQMTTGEGARWGSLMGSLIGLALANPFTGGATASAAGALVAETWAGGRLGAGTSPLDVSWWNDEFGIPKEFVKQIGWMVQAGDSAIFALLRTRWIASIGSSARTMTNFLMSHADHDIVADQFCGYGGTILGTTLSPGQRAKVEDILRGKAA